MPKAIFRKEDPPRPGEGEVRRIRRAFFDGKTARIANPRQLSFVLNTALKCRASGIPKAIFRKEDPPRPGEGEVRRIRRAFFDGKTARIANPRQLSFVLNTALKFRASGMPKAIFRKEDPPRPGEGEVRRIRRAIFIRKTARIANPRQLL